MSLTPKAISAMFRMSGSQENPSFSPVVQVVHLKKIDNKGGGGDERWKVCTGRLLFRGRCIVIPAGGVMETHLNPPPPSPCHRSFRFPLAAAISSYRLLSPFLSRSFSFT